MTDIQTVRLPKLPGYIYKDPTINKYHISSKCKVINGYNFVKTGGLSFGNRPLDVDSIGFIETDNTTRFNPRLMYGKTTSPYIQKFIPHHAIYANKCLTFNGYYKQFLPFYPKENFLIHYVNIHYFLEDDTITVIEPKIPNSGYMEGRIIRRRRIEKPDSNEFWHWRDLNTGIDIDLQGIIFHTTNCDAYTKEFMRSQGIDLNPPEEDPQEKVQEVPKYNLFQRPSKQTEISKYKNRNDVLNFHCLWEDTTNSELNREYILQYYLEDGTMTIKEIYKENDGQDLFPKLLKRMKVPKEEEKYFQPIYQDSVDEFKDYYQAEDLIVGETLNIFGRNLLILNCDSFTRNFYKTVLKIKQPESVDLEKKSQVKVNPFEKEMKDFRYKVNKMTVVYPKDELKRILNANKYLRYSAKMVSAHPEDLGREFILSYSLADDTIKITELNKQDFGGTFLSRRRIPKGCADSKDDFYIPADLYIGALINVYKHVFRITGADLKVYKYVEENKNRFPSNVFDSLKEYMLQNKYIRSECLQRGQQNEDACYLKHCAKNGLVDYQVKEQHDFDAPSEECRYPHVVRGKLMPPVECAHVQEMIAQDLKYKEKQLDRAAKYYQPDIIETHNRVECPKILECLTENPYSPYNYKKFSKVC